ncbi:SAF domain-containing protein [Frankia sp. BMG5.23]|uniref:SAF domain-containing protein n=1 Tax=Frankia sp. BMG5.23 TaxID=683305 RepID=UPI000461B41E|nr:SAF domain-containing protein [Frankia sp. BMG5.23]KDA41620.1 hypothetical protein BMG523Draft_03558 [Frankia sp. BMG5.23]
MTRPARPTDHDWIADDLDPGPQSGVARRRWGGAAVALLLMVLGAAGALWLSSDDARRVEVVALARPLARGTVVAPADLAVVGVDARGGSVRLATPATARRALVGRPVLLDLPAGTLLSPEMVGSVTAPAGQVSIGVTVGPDGLPSASVRTGDAVGVLGFDTTTGRAVVLARDVRIAEVRPPAATGRSGDTVVYLALPERLAETVETAATSEHGVRLFGVGGGSSPGPADGGPAGGSGDGPGQGGGG